MNKKTLPQHFKPANLSFKWSEINVQEIATFSPGGMGADETFLKVPIIRTSESGSFYRGHITQNKLRVIPLADETSYIGTELPEGKSNLIDFGIKGDSVHVLIHTEKTSGAHISQLLEISSKGEITSTKEGKRDELQRELNTTFNKSNPNTSSRFFNNHVIGTSGSLIISAVAASGDIPPEPGYILTHSTETTKPNEIRLGTLTLDSSGNLIEQTQYKAEMKLNKYTPSGKEEITLTLPTHKKFTNKLIGEKDGEYYIKSQVGNLKIDYYKVKPEKRPKNCKKTSTHSPSNQSADAQRHGKSPKPESQSPSQTQQDFG